MSVRPTSIEAYNDIMNSGSLNRRRREVYAIVYQFGPLSATEVGTHLPDYRANCRTADRNIHSRLTELKKMGVIKEVGTGPCSVTGKNVIFLDVTGNFPIPLKKEKTYKFTRQQLFDVGGAELLKKLNIE